MNPTEEFIKKLAEMLGDHEEKTGARIMNIRISRYSFRECTDIRDRLMITDIKLEMV